MADEIPTVPIHADLYDAALRMCNDLRRKRGKRPLRKLPAGVPGDPNECPCGKATGLRFGYGDIEERTSQFLCKMPDDAKPFPEVFDAAAAERGYGIALPIRTVQP